MDPRFCTSVDNVCWVNPFLTVSISYPIDYLYQVVGAQLIPPTPGTPGRRG